MCTVGFCKACMLATNIAILHEQCMIPYMELPIHIHVVCLKRYSSKILNISTCKYRLYGIMFTAYLIAMR